MVALIKPQFEAGREQIGKKGIVKDKKVHLAVLEKVTAFMMEAGFSVRGLDFSPIQGGGQCGISGLFRKEHRAAASLFSYDDSCCRGGTQGI